MKKSASSDNWLVHKWKTKKLYILPLLLLVGYLLVQTVIFSAEYNPGDVGVLVGMVMFLIIWFGPVALIQVRKIKVSHPKTKFIEPT